MDVIEPLSIIILMTKIFLSMLVPLIIVVFIGNVLLGLEIEKEIKGTDMTKLVLKRSRRKGDSKIRLPLPNGKVYIKSDSIIVSLSELNNRITEMQDVVSLSGLNLLRLLNRRIMKVLKHLYSADLERFRESESLVCDELYKYEELIKMLSSDIVPKYGRMDSTTRIEVDRGIEPLLKAVIGVQSKLTSSELENFNSELEILKQLSK